MQDARLRSGLQCCSTVGVVMQSSRLVSTLFDGVRCSIEYSVPAAAIVTYFGGCIIRIRTFFSTRSKTWGSQFTVFPARLPPRSQCRGYVRREREITSRGKLGFYFGAKKWYHLYSPLKMKEEFIYVIVYVYKKVSLTPTCLVKRRITGWLFVDKIQNFGCHGSSTV